MSSTPKASEPQLATVTSLEEQRLAREALPLLNQVIDKLGRHLGHTQREDLRSIGLVAIAKLVRRYDPERSPFGAFMRTRLRWAVIDGIRQETHGRVLAARARALAASDDLLAAAAAERAEGSAQSLEKLSDTDKLPTETDYRGQMQQMLREQATALGIALAGARAAGPVELPAPDSSSNPEKLMLRRTLADELREVIDELPDERQRIVIEGHYFKDLTLEEVGETLGLSRSWTSRLHLKAMRFLAHRLRERGMKR